MTDLSHMNSASLISIAKSYFGKDEVFTQHRPYKPAFEGSPDVVIQEYEEKVDAVYEIVKRPLPEGGAILENVMVSPGSPEVLEIIKPGLPPEPEQPEQWLISSDGETWEEVVPGIPEWDALIAEAASSKSYEEFKANRSLQISNLTVTVDGLEFDADEVSQERMNRAVTVLEDGETVTWKLSNNEVVDVTKEQLKQALRKAGEAQTTLWFGQ